MLLNLKGLRCPQPLLEIKLALRDVTPGESVVAIIDDHSSKRDVPAYLEGRNIAFQSSLDNKGELKLVIAAKG